MANYNLTNVTDANTILDFATAVNGLTGDVYFVFVNVMMLLVAFVAMKNFDTQTAFASATFISAALSGVLWSVGLVGEAVLLAFFVLFVLAIGIKAYGK